MAVIQSKNIDETLRSLSLKEKVSLLAAGSYWRTPSIPAKGIKALKMSDGPNGARGEAIHASTKAACFPCGACLGATFNVDLLQEVGSAIGKDAQSKNVSVLLGPTMNIHRHPYSGRNFETYSEDPILSGELAAAYISGLQSKGVAATPKHFVCNECEVDRNKSNSIIDEKVLRELYLLPFQISMRKGDPWALMTAYNKVNGIYCSENPHLLQDIVRKEWNFTGAIMSDFEGTYHEVEPVLAGLNLEMPGPSIHRGPKLLANVQAGKISEADIDANARYIVDLAAKVGMIDEKAPERAVQDDAISAIVRQAATEGQVLLKNENNILPLAKDTKIAVFGAPASTPIINGGGSSTVNPHYIVTPLQALQSKFPNLQYHYGVPVFRKIPSAPLDCMTTASGDKGVDCFWFNGWTFGENEIHRERLETTRTLVIDPRIKGLEAKHCTRMSFTLTPKTTGTHSFGITSNGETRLYVDGVELLMHPGFPDTKVEYIMEPGRFETRATIPMTANQEYAIQIDSLSTTSPPPPPPAFQIAPQATQVGFFENLTKPDLEAAKQLAASSEVSIIFTGNTKDWESESFDRMTLSLSDSQLSLIETIASVSKQTVVVNQTGAPISMPWLASVSAVLQSWFGGMEVGNAIADVLAGYVSPSGRLPTTFPVSIDDVPANANFPADKNLNIHYAEGLNVGYRALTSGAVTKKPLFPFGHGLSYATFKYSDLTLSRPHTSSSASSISSSSRDYNLTIQLTVTNTSATIPAHETIQIYINGLLKAVRKPFIPAQTQWDIEIKLDKYAFSEWEPIEDEEKDKSNSNGTAGVATKSQQGRRGHWIVKPGKYKIEARKDALTKIVGTSWEIQEVDSFAWTGL